MAQFVKIIERDRSRQTEKYVTCDQLAAVIRETKKVCASVELHSPETRGRMVVDLNTAAGKTYNVCIVTRINQALYEQLVTAAFSLL